MQSCWNKSRGLALFTVVMAGILVAQLRPLAELEQARQLSSAGLPLRRLSARNTPFATIQLMSD